MGIFRPLVNRAQQPTTTAEFTPSERILTPPTVMTAARPALALKAAEMLTRGKRGVIPVVLTMAATDMEGLPARLIDKYFPESGMGSSEFGIKADPFADTSALMIVGAAALKAPRVTTAGKAAIGAVLAAESNKALWYKSSAAAYAAATRTASQPEGHELVIPVTRQGKEAMVEKFAGVALAIATNDTDNWRTRTGLSAGALYFAGQGAWRGEQARREMDQTFLDMMNEATVTGQSIAA